jgi:hypothetical protein
VSEDDDLIIPPIERSEEMDSLIEQVLRQPPMSQDPEEIRKWAERIANDVADLMD